MGGQTHGLVSSPDLPQPSDRPCAARLFLGPGRWGMARTAADSAGYLPGDPGPAVVVEDQPNAGGLDNDQEVVQVQPLMARQLWAIPEFQSLAQALDSTGPELHLKDTVYAWLGGRPAVIDRLRKDVEADQGRDVPGVVLRFLQQEVSTARGEIRANGLPIRTLIRMLTGRTGSLDPRGLTTLGEGGAAAGTMPAVVTLAECRAMDDQIRRSGGTLFYKTYPAAPELWRARNIVQACPLTGDLSAANATMALILRHSVADVPSSLAQFKALASLGP